MDITAHLNTAMGFYMADGNISAADTIGKQLSYKVGDKIAQLIILPLPQYKIEEVEELSESERGTKGFGSSGA